MAIKLDRGARARARAEQGGLRWRPQQAMNSAIIPVGPQDHGKPDA